MESLQISNLTLEVTNLNTRTRRQPILYIGKDSELEFISEANTVYSVKILRKDGIYASTGDEIGFKLLSSGSAIPTISTTSQETQTNQLSSTDFQTYIGDGEGYYSQDYYQFSDYYELTDLKAEKPVRVDLSSTDFITSIELINLADTQRHIFSARGNQDDKNSFFTFTPQPNIRYGLRVTSNNARITGNYDLTTTPLTPSELNIASNLEQLNEYTKKEQLTVRDSFDPNSIDQYIKDYQLKNTTSGKPISIKLVSPDFDAYLEIIDATTQKVIYEDFNSGGNSLNPSFPKDEDAHLIFTPEAGKNYVVRASSSTYRGTGNFTLTAQTLATINAAGQIINDQSLNPANDVYRPNDSIYYYSGRYFVDSYELIGEEVGKPVHIKLNSTQFDARLEVVDASNGNVIISDSNSGVRNTGNSTYSNASIIFTPQADKKYIIRITSDNPQGIGSYSLSTGRLETVDVNATINRALDINTDIFYSGKLSDSYLLKGFTSGEIINFNLSSPSGAGANNQEFSTELQIIDIGTGNVVASSMEGFRGSEINSDVLFIAQAGKNYIVRVNNRDYSGAGSYRLQSQSLTKISANTSLSNLNIANSDAKHPNIVDSYSDYFEITNLNPGKKQLLE
ncbi:MAG: hypothetical protein HC785_11625 [Calothrix sp. CSU_2_0]|nr:hypothetical protein [Calothrix sp. CSU_2_0]